MQIAMAERKNQLPHLLGVKGLTVYGLAKKTQMPYHQVNRIVHSPVIPDGIEYKTLRRLAEALDVTLNELEIEE